MTHSFAGIIPLSDISILSDHFKNLKSDSLVIFDVDYVLIMPEDDYSFSRNIHRKKLWTDIQNKSSIERVKFLHSIVTINAKWRLVDPKVLDVISILRKQKIPTLALTSLHTGKLGIIPNREDLRFVELKNVGIDFADLTPIKGEILIKQFQTDDGIPMLKNGVILTAQIDKGKVLEYIFHTRNYYPKNIIFIDDDLKNVESIEKVCKKLNIPFNGFHYIAHSLMKEPSSLKEIEEFRMKTLEKEHRWVSFEEIEQYKKSNLIKE